MATYSKPITVTILYTSLQAQTQEFLLRILIRFYLYPHASWHTMHYPWNSLIFMSVFSNSVFTWCLYLY